MTETVVLEELLKNSNERLKAEIHCSLPGKVVSYDHNLQKAKIKPLLNKKYIESGDTVELNVIDSVLVVWPSSNDSKTFMHLPLFPGDRGVIHFIDRSIEEWLSGEGKEVLPKHKRRHDINDAIFVPGLNPFKKSFSPANNADVIIKHSNITLNLDPSGKLSIVNTSEELITVLVDVVKELQNIIVNTGTGQVIPPFTTAMLAIQTRLETFKI
jgi:hypothetical protein